MDASDFGIGTVLQQIQAIRIHDLRGTSLYNRLHKLHQSGNPPPQLIIITDKDEKRPKAKSWNEDFDETEVYICYDARVITLVIVMYGILGLDLRTIISVL